ncbi:MAG TPA: hypothetical protein VLA34_11820 [Candidatus Krumholzibacterium sp.]|nr:hypothetical protein [Candidatus Krumholzibacterium sp.]
MISAVLAPFLFSAGQAKDLVLLADSFSSYHNEGYSDLTSCGSGCLYGLDCDGDWVEYTFSISEFGPHATLLYVQGMLNTKFHLQMTLTAVGTVDQQTFDFNFTGLGFG